MHSHHSAWILPVIVFIGLFDAVSQPPPITPNTGWVADGIYHNAFFNFSYTLPLGWDATGKDAPLILQITESGTLTPLQSIGDFHILLRAAEPDSGLPAKVRAGLYILAERLPAAGNITKPEQYLALFTETLRADKSLTLADVRVEAFSQQVPSSERNFARALYSGSRGQQLFEQVVLVTLEKGYALTFIVFGGYLDQQKIRRAPLPSFGIGPEQPKRVMLPTAVAQNLVIERVHPTFPPLSRQNRTRGRIILKAVVDREGRVTNLRIVSCGGCDFFGSDKAVYNAVKAWRFKPHTIGGEPVEFETDLAIDFVARP